MLYSAKCFEAQENFLLQRPLYHRIFHQTTQIWVYRVSLSLYTAVSSGSDEEEEEEEERDSHHPQISIEHSPPTATARKASAPAILHSRIMQKIQHGGPARRHTDLSPCISPQTSPRHSAMGMSPSTSPRASPSGVRRGLRVSSLRNEK